MMAPRWIGACPRLIHDGGIDHQGKIADGGEFAFEWLGSTEYPETSRTAWEKASGARALHGVKAGGVPSTGMDSDPEAGEGGVTCEKD